VFVQLGEEERELVAAGRTARAPEVDDDRPAPERRQVERLPVERRPIDGRGRLASGEKRCLGGTGRGDQLRELDEGDRRDERGREPDDDVPAPPVQLQRRDGPT
jgi:hypothetical protein